MLLAYPAVIALLAAAPAATPTPRPSPTAAPAPPAALETLRSFEGKWVCEPAAGTEGQGRTRLTVKPTLDGYWLSGEAREDKTAGNPKPATRLFFWGHDAVLGKLVGGFLDNRGGWSTQTSLGWDEGKLVMLGHVTSGTEKVSARETFTSPEAGTFTRTYEVLGFIEWRLVRQETCRKER